MSIAIALVIAAGVAVFAGALTSGDRETTPPVGWAAVVFMAELVGMVLGSAL